MSPAESAGPPLPPEAPLKSPGADIPAIGCGVAILVAILTPVAIVALIALANAYNPDCGTPGDSGGCEIGLAAGGLVGVGLGLVAAISCDDFLIASLGGFGPPQPKHHTQKPSPSNRLAGLFAFGAAAKCPRKREGQCQRSRRPASGGDGTEDHGRFDHAAKTHTLVATPLM